MKNLFMAGLSVLFALGLVISAMSICSPAGDAFWVMTPLWLPALALVAGSMLIATRDLVSGIFAAGTDN